MSVRCDEENNSPAANGRQIGKKKISDNFMYDNNSIYELIMLFFAIVSSIKMLSEKKI